MKKLYFLSLLSWSAFSQTFYVVGLNEETESGNSCQLVNLQDCSKTPITLCTTSDITGDIAVDSSGNLYFVDASRALLRQNHNEITCEQIGTFPLISGSNPYVNALVVDSNGYLFAVANPALGSGIQRGRLYKYSASEGIVELGLLPPQTVSTGDLFFFENRLFLIAKDVIANTTFLLEVNIIHPELSTVYMAINTIIPPYGAFSTYNEGVSKSYLLSRAFVVGEGTINEVSIPQQTITLMGCNVNALVGGADAYYELSNSLLSISSYTPSVNYFNVVNPATYKIVIDTNINSNTIKSLSLFDITGRKAKDFVFQRNIDLPVFDVKSGMYILELNTADGSRYRQKVLIKN